MGAAESWFSLVLLMFTNVAIGFLFYIAIYEIHVFQQPDNGKLGDARLICRIAAPGRFNGSGELE